MRVIFRLGVLAVALVGAAQLHAQQVQLPVSRTLSVKRVDADRVQIVCNLEVTGLDREGTYRVDAALYSAAGYIPVTPVPTLWLSRQGESRIHDTSFSGSRTASFSGNGTLKLQMDGVVTSPDIPTRTVATSFCSMTVTNQATGEVAASTVMRDDNFDPTP